MNNSQYYTTRRNKLGIFMMEELYTGTSTSSIPNYEGYTLSFTTAPAVGQLIVLTTHSRNFNVVGGVGPAPTIGGQPFLLAARGGTYGAISPGARSYMAEIWYRTATAADAANSYTVYFWADGVNMLSATKFSGGTYWGTPEDPNVTPDSTYANRAATGSTSTIIAGATGVNVSTGGFVIAAGARFTSTSTPTVNNSFSLTSQSYSEASFGAFHVARRDNYDAAAVAQNTTFSYSGNDYMASAIAAFNP
jgi:hypothetical protein